MLFEAADDVHATLDGVIDVRGNSVAVLDPVALRGSCIDDLVYNAFFHPSADIRYYAHWLIHELAADREIYPSSIQGLYEGLGQQPTKMTVPAFRVETLPYDTARACFRAAAQTATGAFIFLRSEGAQPTQTPLQFASAVLAAAIKEGYSGPVFLQNDLFVDRERYGRDREGEVDALKDHIAACLNAGFFNLLLDTSALADYGMPTFDEQQGESAALAAELASFVRDSEPAEVVSSIGAEIGELCDRQKTAHELRAFVGAFEIELETLNDQAEGLAKIVLHTGLEQPAARISPRPIVDFDALKDLVQVARREYGLVMGVRGGLDPLPDEAFDLFPANEVGEVQIAGRFHLGLLEHHGFPASLIAEMQQWVDSWVDRLPGEGDEAYYQRGREIALGAFQKRLWDLPDEVRSEVRETVQERFASMMRRLGVATTSGLVRDTIDIENVALPVPAEGYDQTAETKLADILAHLPTRPPHLR